MQNRLSLSNLMHEKALVQEPVVSLCQGQVFSIEYTHDRLILDKNKLSFAALGEELSDFAPIRVPFA